MGGNGLYFRIETDTGHGLVGLLRGMGLDDGGEGKFTTGGAVPDRVGGI
jgi:hypothetical protein